MKVTHVLFPEPKKIVTDLRVQLHKKRQQKGNSPQPAPRVSPAGDDSLENATLSDEEAAEEEEEDVPVNKRRLVKKPGEAKGEGRKILVPGAKRKVIEPDVNIMVNKHLETGKSPAKR